MEVRTLYNNDLYIKVKLSRKKNRQIKKGNFYNKIKEDRKQKKRKKRV